MEKKPVVTCYGDQSLFYNLAGRVAQNLPKEPIDWKRSYGRPPKTVHVEAQFVFLEERLLQSAVHFALTEQPFFHIFWVEVCELDRYKSSVKDDISNWISILKKYNADQEWMVVIVSGMGSQEAKTPNRKINPLRTSIDDKIRADFCPKHPERVTSLLDPSKHDRGAAESWQTFMDRLRSQLMNAFNQHVSLFEDHMRTEREKRTQASWNFMDFFLLQEELAFAYEMMGLYEDALIQYDELDATFSQFVLNAGAGATTGLEWLASFTSRDVTAWDGICLSFPINQEKREMLKKRTASLLDFRNYVFSRQCSLLLLLCRPWEVARRSLPFMHQTLNELKILEVSLTDGAEACWVFLSCLEVLHTCEKYSDSSEMENYSLHTANLWAYAREKLLHLGGLCGLMPDVETSSDQLQHVIELVAGMGDRHFDVPGSPMAKLREALSSKNAFQKLYMEVAELAMGTYKHIGRIRSARLIGRDLARFYMKMGEYHKAESFFLDLLRMYQTSHWDRLTIAICKEMALCYQATGETHKYFKILTELAASSFCDPEMRKFYQKELLDCAKMIQTHLMDGSEEAMTTSRSSRSSSSSEKKEDEDMESMTKVTFIPVFEAKTLSLCDALWARSAAPASPGDSPWEVPPLEFAPGEEITVELRLVSHLTQQLLPEALAMTITRLGTNGPALQNGHCTPGRVPSHEESWTDGDSPHVFHFPPALANPLATWEGERLQMVSRLDLGQPGPQRTIVAAYVACKNPAATLRKLDSVYQLMRSRNPPQNEDDGVQDHMELKNPRIYPGSNLLYLKTVLPEDIAPGLYGFGRMSISLFSVDFLENIPDFAGIRFRIMEKGKEKRTRVKIETLDETAKVARNAAPLHLASSALPAGHARMLRASFLNMSHALSFRDSGFGDAMTPLGDHILNGDSRPLAVSLVATEGCQLFTQNRDQSFVIQDILDPYEPYVKDLCVVGNHRLTQEEAGPPPPSPAPPPSPSPPGGSHRATLVFNCSWLSSPVEEALWFCPSLRARHHVHAAPRGRKPAALAKTLVQVVVQLRDPQSEDSMTLKEPELVAAGVEVENSFISSLNSGDPEHIVDCDIDVSFIWELSPTQDDVNPLKLKFSAFVDSVSPANDAGLQYSSPGSSMSVPLVYCFEITIPD